MRCLRLAPPTLKSLLDEIKVSIITGISIFLTRDIYLNFRLIRENYSPKPLKASYLA